MAKEEKAVETTEEVEDTAVDTTEETAPKASEKKPEKKPAKTEKKPEKKPGFFKRIARFFKDLKGEFKKIVWPTKKQVVNNTIVVIVTCVIAGIFVWGLDTVLVLLLNFILGKA